MIPEIILDKVQKGTPYKTLSEIDGTFQENCNYFGFSLKDS